MQSKRGVSAVVATVLIILITVAAVGIIWAAIMPLVRDSIDSSKACFDAQSDVSIVTDSGFTCIEETLVCSGIYNTTGCFSDAAYVANVTGGEVFVQVQKGPNNEFSLVGVQILVSINGSTLSEIVKESLPGNNEERVINVTNASYAGAQKVSIAPIVTVGRTEETCAVSQEVILSPCTN